MRNTVVTDDELLDEARQVLGTSAVRETIEVGLKEAIRRKRLDELRSSLSQFEIDLTPEELAQLGDDR